MELGRRYEMSGGAPTATATRNGGTVEYLPSERRKNEDATGTLMER
jgi:hypothetical protein